MRVRKPGSSRAMPVTSVIVPAVYVPFFFTLHCRFLILIINNTQVFINTFRRLFKKIGIKHGLEIHGWRVGAKRNIGEKCIMKESLSRRDFFRIAGGGAIGLGFGVSLFLMGQRAPLRERKDQGGMITRGNLHNREETQ